MPSMHSHHYNAVVPLRCASAASGSTTVLSFVASSSFRQHSPRPQPQRCASFAQTNTRVTQASRPCFSLTRSLSHDGSTSFQMPQSSLSFRSNQRSLSHDSARGMHSDRRPRGGVLPSPRPAPVSLALAARAAVGSDGKVAAAPAEKTVGASFQLGGQVRRPLGRDVAVPPRGAGKHAFSPFWKSSSSATTGVDGLVPSSIGQELSPAYVATLFRSPSHDSAQRNESRIFAPTRPSQKKQATLSQSTKIFWRPPPEAAAAICEAVSGQPASMRPCTVHAPPSGTRNAAGARRAMFT